jgi:hypothetical protein
VNETKEFVPALLGLRQTIALAQSALPDAPVVSNNGRDSAPTRARRRIAIAVRRLASRDVPTHTGAPAAANANT